MALLMSHLKERTETVAKHVRGVAWEYQHSSAALALDREADPHKFAAWVATICISEHVSRRILISLYAEFCELHEVRPMTWGLFNLSLKPSGFQRHRLSTAGRPWVYRIARSGSALVLKIPTRAVGPAVKTRRAAA